MTFPMPCKMLSYRFPRRAPFELMSLCMICLLPILSLCVCLFVCVCVMCREPPIHPCPHVPLALPVCAASCSPIPCFLYVPLVVCSAVSVIEARACVCPSGSHACYPLQLGPLPSVISYILANTCFQNLQWRLSTTFVCQKVHGRCF